ncbi:hypothetical protein ACGF13_03845 [Kitasatospora sp. NPDC048286]|uniref:hypothetical protein n=1 Tax=Kitasatospora sp. NPDC048286 TaxID=3364047 RepID=UPI003715BCDA
MRLSVITRFAKNERALSGRRRIAVLAATTILAGGVQFLATDTAWACDGPYSANNSVVSEAAMARHHSGTPVSAFIAPVATSLTAGEKTEFGVEFANFTGAAFDEVAPDLTLKATGGKNHLLPEDVTVEVMRGGSWTKLGTDNGCAGEAVRVDTSPLLQPLADGHAGRALFRITLAAGAPKDLASLTLTTDAWSGEAATGKSASTTVKVVHPGAQPARTAKPTTPAKPAPTTAVEPAADRTKDAAPAATAPAGTAELARTGSSATDTFLALSSALFLTLGAGVLIAVRRLHHQR